MSLSVKTAIAGFVALLSAGAALAQGAPTRFEGKVKAIAADQITLSGPNGDSVVKLAPGWGLNISARTTLSQIQPGSFIGTTNVDIPGGGRSVEIHVFPPGSKAGEGQRIWDAKTGSKMTNGTVGRVVKAADGQELDISFPGGERHVKVPPDTLITSITPSDRATLKPGMSAAVLAFAGPDGVLLGRIITTGPGGTPPAF